MPSRRADVTTPAPLSMVQGAAPIDFESLVRRAIGNASAWRTLVKSPEDQERAYWVLRSWKDDLKAQRRINAGRAMAGDSDTREHSRWLARQAEFEHYVDMRLRELPTFRKNSAPANPSTARILRTRLSEWRTATAAVVRGVLDLESGAISPEDLFALLDRHNVDMGELGRLSLRDAAPHIIGVLEREQPTKDEL